MEESRREGEKRVGGGRGGKEILSAELLIILPGKWHAKHFLAFQGEAATRPRWMEPCAPPPWVWWPRSPGNPIGPVLCSPSPRCSGVRRHTGAWPWDWGLALGLGLASFPPVPSSAAILIYRSSLLSGLLKPLPCHA